MAALLLPLALLAVFLVFRANPQRRRVMGQQALLGQLAPGDKVVTGGGMIGTLVAIEGDRAAVEVAPDVIVEFLLAGILRRADDGLDPTAPPLGGGPAHVAGTDTIDLDHPLVPDDISGLEAMASDPPPTPPVPADDDPSAPHHEEN
jgi:preprotein translocase subunit YajC